MNTLHMIRRLSILATISIFSYGILPSCTPSEKAKDDATEVVRETTNAEIFTKDTYDKLLVAEAHGTTAPKQVFLVTVTITNVKAIREDGRTEISLTGTLWAGSKVEGNFLFAESSFDYVAARKPGEAVVLKCQLSSISSDTVYFIGAIPENEPTPEIDG